MADNEEVVEENDNEDDYQDDYEGELEYVDANTIARAIQGRIDLS